MKTLNILIAMIFSLQSFGQLALHVSYQPPNGLASHDLAFGITYSHGFANGFTLNTSSWLNSTNTTQSMEAGYTFNSTGINPLMVTAGISNTKAYGTAKEFVNAAGPMISGTAILWVNQGMVFTYVQGKRFGLGCGFFFWKNAKQRATYNACFH